MPELKVGEILLEVNEEGFIQHPEKWNEQVATSIARAEGLKELTDKHWKVVRYVRRYYLEFGVAPMIRKICQETGLSRAELHQLFPSGPAKGACRIAGLPKTTGCV